MMSSAEKYTLDDLLYLMERLRDPQHGCPWDLQQNFHSIAPHTLEECYEVLDAIESGDHEHLCEELGDLLFQVVYYGQLAAEECQFDFARIVDGVVGKLLRRHPHVFPEGALRDVNYSAQRVSSAQVKEEWEQRKSNERKNRRLVGRLDGIPPALPALSRAQKLQKRASTHGFDWSEIRSVIDKLEEELAEFKEALCADEVEAVRDEMGDLLFCCVNLCRHLDLDAEQTLRGANRKFAQRFATMEGVCQREHLVFETLSADQKNQLWERAKALCDTPFGRADDEASG